jgi:hypothetical protein
MRFINAAQIKISTKPSRKKQKRTKTPKPNKERTKPSKL